MCYIGQAHAREGASLMMKRLEPLAPGAPCDGELEDCFRGTCGQFLGEQHAALIG